MENQLEITSKQDKKKEPFRNKLSKLINSIMHRERGDYLFKIISDIIHIDSIDDLNGNQFIIMEKKILGALSNLFHIKRSSINTIPTKSTRSLESYSYYNNHFKQRSDKPLGSGASGKVFTAQHRLDQMVYAIKMIPIKCLSMDNIIESLREVTTLAKLNHENIVQYKYAWIEPMKMVHKIIKNNGNSELSSSGSDSTSENSSTDSQGSKDLPFKKEIKTPEIMLYIQMNLCEQSLRTWLDKRFEEKNFSSSLTIDTIAFQIINALNYIHSMNIVHHDINPNNIFVTSKSSKLHIQLGDFGLACSSKQNGQCGEIGTVTYSDPYQSNEFCNFKSDIYSFGIVLFELLLGPITAKEFVEHLGVLKKGFLPELNLDYKLWANMLLELTHENPRYRPAASELLERINKQKDFNLRSYVNQLSCQNLNLISSNIEKDNVIENLKTQNRKKGYIIQSLRQKLRTAENQIARLNAVLL